MKKKHKRIKIINAEKKLGRKILTPKKIFSTDSKWNEIYLKCNYASQISSKKNFSFRSIENAHFIHWYCDYFL